MTLLAIASTAYLPLVTGLGGIAAGAAGGSMLMGAGGSVLRTSCPRTTCARGGRCCPLLLENGRPICPSC